MQQLSRDQFRRARQFLKAEARPLDSALFSYRFEGETAERVTEELAPYQNADGGFGHALEPDVRTPSSSALATGIALGILKELDRPAEDPIVASAVGYLLQTFDAEQRVWRAVPRDANDHPHAPWWHDDDGSLARTFDGFFIIPRAQIVALIHHYAELVPGDWLETVTEETVFAVETLEQEAFEGGGDTLRYALDLAEAHAVPARFNGRLLPRLRALTEDIVCREPEAWGDYCATPLKVAPTPDSAVADILWDDLQRNLNYEVDHQTSAGSWEPTWTWGPRYPDAWAKAKLEWRGHLTLETLTTLRAFGRIEA